MRGEIRVTDGGRGSEIDQCWLVAERQKETRRSLNVGTVSYPYVSSFFKI